MKALIMVTVVALSFSAAAIAGNGTHKAPVKKASVVQTCGPNCPHPCPPGCPMGCCSKKGA